MFVLCYFHMHPILKKENMTTTKMTSNHIMSNNCMEWWWQGDYKDPHWIHICTIWRDGSNTMNQQLSIVCPMVAYRISYNCFISLMIRNLMQRIFEWNKVFDSPKHDDHDHDAHIYSNICLFSLCQVWFDGGWVSQVVMAAVYQVWMRVV